MILTSGEKLLTTLKKAALAYAARGWPIFPVRSDKTPYTKNGVLDATTNPEQIEIWWNMWPDANIGLDVGGAGMMVLDLDPGYSMEELEKNVGKIPETKLWATTPRGGQHLFFRLGEGEVVAPSASRLAAHVDVRSHNSYVLLAPSKTKDGSYEWGGEGKPHYRTDEMLRLANTGREKHKDRDEWKIEPDLPENIASAIKWLKTDAKIAIEGQGGDSMAYKTAAHMKSFGISEELAFDLMWQYWNPRCSPPWTADNIEHLRRKVRNGHQYNTSPPGNVTPAYHAAKIASLFTPVGHTPKGGMSPTGRHELASGGYEWKDGRFRIVDRQGMASIKPPSWLITDLMQHDTYVMLFGNRSTFKTFLALDIALSIATGGIGLSDDNPWPEVQSQGPVLFAVGEGRSGISARVRAWEKRHYFGREVDAFRLGDPVPRVSESLELETFIENARDASPTGKYELVVLDTVGKAMQGLNENAQEHASAFTETVDCIRKELGCTVLALHHTGHGDQTRARGSSVFGADVDTEIRLDREGEKNIVSLTMTKQKDAPEWKKKKYIKLEKIILSLDPLIDSLVAVSGKDIAAKAEKKEEQQTEDTGILQAIVEEAIIKHLKGLPGRQLSNQGLAEAVATMKGVNCGEKQLLDNYLKRARQNNGGPAHHLYHKDDGRWYWATKEERKPVAG